MPKNPIYLFHYTSLETFYALFNQLKYNDERIISKSSFTLRATSAYYMNDPTEYDYYLDLLFDALENNHYKKPREERMEGFIRLLDKFYNKLKGVKYSPAILSFSECRDNLPMWRCYGNDGKGIAIGISFKELEKYLKNEIEKSFSKDLIKCKYRDEKSLLKEINAEKIYNFFTDNGGIKNSDNFNGFYDEYIKRENYKHSSYKYEKEWRLFSYDRDRYDFFTKNGNIIPFIPFQFPVSLIKKIIVGPSSYNDQFLIDTIELFLKSKISDIKIGKGKGNHIEIITSQIPYITE